MNMEYISALTNGVYWGFGFSVGLSVLYFLFKLFLIKFPNLTISQFFRSRITKFNALKLENLGFRVFIYVSWLDRFNLSIKDLKREEHLVIEDPLIFEQHSLRSFPFNAGVGCLAYRKKDLNIIGRLYRINSDSNGAKSIIYRDKD